MATYEQHQKQRDEVFRAPENHDTPAAQPTTVANLLIRKAKVFTLPPASAADAAMVKAFHMFLIVCGTSESQDRYEWQNYVVSLVGLCFSSFRAGILADPAYVEVYLSEAQQISLKDWFAVYSSVTDADLSDGDRKEALAMAQDMLPKLELPTGVVSADVDFDDVLDVPSVYGHVSLVLFLAGKTITERNRPAILQKRPGALERKYYNGKVVASLSGALRLSSAAHTFVHLSFVALTHFRREVFTGVALFNTTPGDAAIEVVATTTRLMRYAGMQQAIIVDGFLSSHEEAFSIPLVIPSIRAYTASMRDLTSAPVELRPYYKLIHGDTTRAFNRNDIMTLLTVALVEAREINPTLQNYNIPPNYQLVMDKYRQSLATLAETEVE